MAKAASPIRLQKSLMQAATLAGSTQHRSATEQVEYWADLGRKVEAQLNSEDLLAVSAGLKRLRLEAVEVNALDVDAVFAKLQTQSETGALSEAIHNNGIRYQASGQPGLLAQCHPDGQVVLGQFVNGRFKAQQ